MDSKPYCRIERQELARTVRYSYFNLGDDEAHAVVASAVIPYGDDYRHHYGIAWCSPKDRFERKKGRLLAQRRLHMAITTFGHEILETNPGYAGTATLSAPEPIRPSAAALTVVRNTIEHINDTVDPDFVPLDSDATRWGGPQWLSRFTVEDVQPIVKKKRWQKNA